MKVAALLILSLVLFVAVTYAAYMTGFGPSNAVTLEAAAWNNGSVHLWHGLRDGPDAAYTDIPDGARCTRLDGATYKLGSGATAIYYYRLACGGVTGYVQSDQVR